MLSTDFTFNFHNFGEDSPINLICSDKPLFCIIYFNIFRLSSNYCGSKIAFNYVVTWLRFYCFEFFAWINLFVLLHTYIDIGLYLSNDLCMGCEDCMVQTNIYFFVAFCVDLDIFVIIYFFYQENFQGIVKRILLYLRT